MCRNSHTSESQDQESGVVSEATVRAVCLEKLSRDRLKLERRSRLTSSESLEAITIAGLSMVSEALFEKSNPLMDFGPVAKIAPILKDGMPTGRMSTYIYRTGESFAA